MKNLYLEMLELRSKGGEVDENFQNPKVDTTYSSGENSPIAHRPIDSLSYQSEDCKEDDYKSLRACLLQIFIICKSSIT